MKTMLATAALAAAVWSCDARAASVPPSVPAQAQGPEYTATVKIDDV